MVVKLKNQRVPAGWTPNPSRLFRNLISGHTVKVPCTEEPKVRLALECHVPQQFVEVQGQNFIIRTPDLEWLDESDPACTICGDIPFPGQLLLDRELGEDRPVKRSPWTEQPAGTTIANFMTASAWPLFWIQTKDSAFIVCSSSRHKHRKGQGCETMGNVYSARVLQREVSIALPTVRIGTSAERTRRRNGSAFLHVLDMQIPGKG